MNEPINIIMDKLSGWYELLLKMLPNFAVALIVLLVFFVLAKITKGVVRKLIKSVTSDHYLQKFTVIISYILVITGGVLIALNILNLDKTVTSFLAGAGIIGLALGFAFQESATNLMAGVMMIVKKPIEIGDHIEVDGEHGIVLEVSLRVTKLKTFDGQLVLIPNKDIFQGRVKNYNTEGRRVDIEVGVSYGDDLSKVIDVLKGTLINIKYIDREKDIDVFFTEFGGSSINLSTRFWLNRENISNFLSAKSEAIMKIKEAFDENDIDIPFPIRTLDFGIKGGQELKDQIKLKSKNGMQVAR